MTALLCLAAAVIAAPGRHAAQRLRTLGLPGGVQSRESSAAPLPVALARHRAAPLLVVACPVGVALVVAGALQAVAVGLLAGTAVHLRSGGRRRRRDLAELAAWERRLDETVSAVRSGAAPLASTGADTGVRRDDAADEALRTAAAVARLGGSAADSLRSRSDPVAAELGSVWAVAERHGVPLAAVLDGLRGDVAGRRERSMRVESALAGPRATAVILTALPGLGVLMGSGIGADPLGTLGHGLLGGVLSLVGATLLAAGLLWTDRIVAGARS